MTDAPEDDLALELAAFEIDHGCCTGALFPVSLLALGKASKFATEPPCVFYEIYDGTIDVNIVK